MNAEQFPSVWAFRFCPNGSSSPEEEVLNLSFLSLDRTGQELIGPVAPHPAPAQHLRDLPPPALVGLVPASDGKAPHTASLSLLLHRKGNRGSESRWVWLLGTGEDDSGPRTLPQAASSAHEGPLSLSSFCPHGCSGGRGRESRGSSSFLLTGLASWQVSHFPLPHPTLPELPALTSPPSPG